MFYVPHYTGSEFTWSFHIRLLNNVNIYVLTGVGLVLYPVKVGDLPVDGGRVSYGDNLSFDYEIKDCGII